MTTKNDVTGDRLTSKVNNKKWDENYDRIFKKKKTEDKTVKGKPNEHL